MHALTRFLRRPALIGNGRPEPVPTGKAGVRADVLARRTRRAAVMLTAVAAAALAGCSAATGPVALPPHAPAASADSPSPAASPSPADSMSAEEHAVIQADVGFYKADNKAEESGNIATARRLLRPYLAADEVDGLTAFMASTWAQGERFYGLEDRFHILHVTIKGNDATVHECDDTTRGALRYVSTGKIVPGSQGSKDDNSYTSLKLTRGRWLVQVVKPVNKPCKA